MNSSCIVTGDSATEDKHHPTLNIVKPKIYLTFCYNIYPQSNNFRRANFSQLNAIFYTDRQILEAFTDIDLTVQKQKPKTLTIAFKKLNVNPTNFTFVRGLVLITKAFTIRVNELNSFSGIGSFYANLPQQNINMIQVIKYLPTVHLSQTNIPITCSGKFGRQLKSIVNQFTSFRESGIR